MRSKINMRTLVFLRLADFPCSLVEVLLRNVIAVLTDGEHPCFGDYVAHIGTVEPVGQLSWR